MVHTDARLFTTLIGVHETHFTLAAERAGVVQALPVIAQVRIVCALVHVRANVTVPAEARIANTLQTSFRIKYLSVESTVTLKDPSVLIHWAS